MPRDDAGGNGRRPSRNVLGERLEGCSAKPVTGFFRNGCCDTSPMQHATAHASATGHPFIRSFEPGEDWFYSYDTKETYDGPELAPPPHHPLDQGVPGPTGRVPADWRLHVH